MQRWKGGETGDGRTRDNAKVQRCKSAKEETEMQRHARSAGPTRGRENRISIEVRMLLGERGRRSRAPTRGTIRTTRWGGRFFCRWVILLLREIGRICMCLRQA